MPDNRITRSEAENAVIRARNALAVEQLTGRNKKKMAKLRKNLNQAEALLKAINKKIK